MELTKFDRGQVVGVLLAGKSQKQIVEITGLPESSVNKVIADWNQGLIDPKTGMYVEPNQQDAEVKTDIGKKKKK